MKQAQKTIIKTEFNPPNQSVSKMPEIMYETIIRMMNVVGVRLKAKTFFESLCFLYFSARKTNAMKKRRERIFLYRTCRAAPFPNPVDNVAKVLRRPFFSHNETFRSPSETLRDEELPVGSDECTADRRRNAVPSLEYTVHWPPLSPRDCSHRPWPRDTGRSTTTGKTFVLPPTSLSASVILPMRKLCNTPEEKKTDGRKTKTSICLFPHAKIFEELRRRDAFAVDFFDKIFVIRSEKFRN